MSDLIGKYNCKGVRKETLYSSGGERGRPLSSICNYFCLNTNPLASKNRRLISFMQDPSEVGRLQTLIMLSQCHTSKTSLHIQTKTTFH